MVPGSYGPLGERTGGEVELGDEDTVGDAAAALTTATAGEDEVAAIVGGDSVVRALAAFETRPNAMEGNPSGAVQRHAVPVVILAHLRHGGSVTLTSALAD